jgi:HAD superfamily hydrolase (TIGR01458 family)
VDISGFLIDLDGTLYQGSRLIPGAVEAVDRLRADQVPILFTTNTSRKSQADILASLAGMGFQARREEVFSAPVAAADWLAGQGINRIQLLVPESTRDDFRQFTITDDQPDAVLVGDLGAGFTFERLNEAFRSLRAGARLVAIHRNRFWIPDAGPTLDAGPFVAALEYGAGMEATLVGKPSPAFFHTAAARTGAEPGELAVVGDDVESDIKGARLAGLTAIQVRTGKFDASCTARVPDEYQAHRIIDSIRDLPGLLHD